MVKQKICPKCEKPTWCKRVCKDCIPKKPRGRGSVSRSWRQFIRGLTDKEYRDNRNKQKRISNKKYYKENKDKIFKKTKKWKNELSEFKNNRCKICNKLLDYRTKGCFCRKHEQKAYFSLYRKYRNHEETKKEYRRRYYKK